MLIECTTKSSLFAANSNVGEREQDDRMEATERGDGKGAKGFASLTAQLRVRRLNVIQTVAGSRAVCTVATASAR